MKDRDNDGKNIIAQKSDTDVFPRARDTLKVDMNKKVSVFDKMISFVFSNKRYVLTLFPIILIALFLGSICSSLQKNGYTFLFVFCIVGVFLLLVLSIFLINKAKRRLPRDNISLNIFLGIIFTYMFISGFILMIFFKILSIVSVINTFNLTGLISVTINVGYLVLLVASVFVDLRRIKLVSKK